MCGEAVRPQRGTVEHAAAGVSPSVPVAGHLRSLLAAQLLLQFGENTALHRGDGGLPHRHAAEQAVDVVVAVQLVKRLEDRLQGGLLPLNDGSYNFV